MILTQKEADVSTSWAEFVPEEPYRKGLTLQNKGAETIYIWLGKNGSGTEGVQIPGGGSWDPPFAPKESIHIVAASGTPAVYCLTRG